MAIRKQGCSNFLQGVTSLPEWWGILSDLVRGLPSCFPIFLFAKILIDKGEAIISSQSDNREKEDAMKVVDQGPSSFDTKFIKLGIEEPKTN